MAVELHKWPGIALRRYAVAALKLWARELGFDDLLIKLNAEDPESLLIRDPGDVRLLVDGQRVARIALEPAQATIRLEAPISTIVRYNASDELTEREPELPLNADGGIDAITIDTSELVHDNLQLFQSARRRKVNWQRRPILPKGRKVVGNMATSPMIVSRRHVARGSMGDGPSEW